MKEIVIALNILVAQCGILDKESSSIGPTVTTLECNPCTCKSSESACLRWQADKAEEREKQQDKCNKMKDELKTRLDRYKKGK